MKEALGLTGAHPKIASLPWELGIPVLVKIRTVLYPSLAGSVRMVTIELLKYQGKEMYSFE